MTGIARKSSANVAIDLEHLQRLGHGVVAVGVRGMTFLPEEFGRAQEQARAHLPAHDVRPLVDEQRQIAIALDPALERVADDRLRRRPDDQRLFELGVGIDAPACRPSFFRRWCVTTAISLAKPSTCSASLAMKLIGMKSGK